MTKNLVVVPSTPPLAAARARCQENHMRCRRQSRWGGPDRGDMFVEELEGFLLDGEGDVFSSDNLLQVVLGD